MTEKPSEAYRAGYLDATRAPLRRRRHVSAPYLRKPRSSRWVNQSRTVSPPLFPAWRSPHARKTGPRNSERAGTPFSIQFSRPPAGVLRRPLKPSFGLIRPSISATAVN